MSVMRIRTRPNRALEAGSHLATLWLHTRFPEALPMVMLSGYPKSGTTWMAQLISDYLQLPMPQHSLLPLAHACVLQTHRPLHPRWTRCVYTMRDGRDAMVSLYWFQAKHLAPGRDPSMTRRQRAMFPGLRDRDAIRENLPAFMRRQAARPLGTTLNWRDHVMGFLESKRERTPLLKYEDLLADTRGALSDAMRTLTGEEPDAQRIGWAVEKFSFEKQTGRKKGQEQKQSFLRSGRAGDWSKSFTREAAEVFDELYGDALIATGYEADRSWVSRVGESEPAVETPAGVGA